MYIHQQSSCRRLERFPIKQYSKSKTSTSFKNFRIKDINLIQKLQNQNFKIKDINFCN
jgi:hypothetical protein